MYITPLNIFKQKQSINDHIISVNGKILIGIFKSKNASDLIDDTSFSLS